MAVGLVTTVAAAAAATAVAVAVPAILGMQIELLILLHAVPLAFEEPLAVKPEALADESFAVDALLALDIGAGVVGRVALLSDRPVVGDVGGGGN